jgi:hypothetical protein
MKFKALNKVKTTLGDKGFKSILVDPFIFELDGVRSSVPEGFVFDWASIPRVFWNIIPPRGKYSWAALVHDYLYRVHRFDNKPCTKEFADNVFLAIMTHYGVKKWKRKTMYYAVKWFGKKSWDANG